MIIAGQAKDLMGAVHLAADGSQVATGTMYCVVRLESDDADDGKYWDSNDDTWQASPVAWPTATHTQAGVWMFELPAAATTGKAGDTIHYTLTDDLDESAATTICGGGEHRVWVEDPLSTSDLANLDVTVSSRAAPGDDMGLTVAALDAVADAVWDELAADHVTADTMGAILNALSLLVDPSHAGPFDPTGGLT